MIIGEIIAFVFQQSDFLYLNTHLQRCKLRRRQPMEAFYCMELVETDSQGKCHLDILRPDLLSLLQDQ